MSGVKIGHDWKCEEVLKRVSKKWTFDKFPKPKFKVRCPECGSEEVIIREYGFSLRERGGCPYRCAVRYKCTKCSLVFEFGFPIPEELYKQHITPNKQGRSYHWREVRKLESKK